MKLTLFMAALTLPFIGQTMEYAVQMENDLVRVSKIRMLPGEEAGLHRDENPRVVIGLEGGTITRFEEDGSTRKVVFPTGAGIFLEADPPNGLHSVKNTSKNPIEVIVVELKSKG